MTLPRSGPRPVFARVAVQAFATAILAGTPGLGAFDLAGQEGATSSCFEVRTVEEGAPDLPDSVQVVIHGVAGSGVGGAVLPHVGVGSFTPDGLVVVLRPREGGDPVHLLFRPRGDRMVGWVLASDRGIPDRDEGWAVEAHRFRCPRPDPGPRGQGPRPRGP